MTKAQLEARRLKANYMVLVEKKDQKKVAEILGVSEKSMSSWAKRYNWKSELRAIEKKGGLVAIMDGYFEYVKFCVNKETSQKQRDLWDKYLQRLGADFTKEAL